MFSLQSAVEMAKRRQADVPNKGGYPIRGDMLVGCGGHSSCIAQWYSGMGSDVIILTCSYQHDGNAHLPAKLTDTPHGCCCYCFPSLSPPFSTQVSSKIMTSVV